MNGKNKISTKLSENVRIFLFDLGTNLRLIAKTKNKKRRDISYSEKLELIVTYFKSNNDKYLELIKLYEIKNE